LEEEAQIGNQHKQIMSLPKEKNYLKQEQGNMKLLNSALKWIVLLYISSMVGKSLVLESGIS
jgi:hypothetical protein